MKAWLCTDEDLSQNNPVSQAFCHDALYGSQLIKMCIRDSAIAESIVEQDPAAQSPENEILWRQLKALRKTNVNWAAIS